MGEKSSQEETLEVRFNTKPCEDLTGRLFQAVGTAYAKIPECLGNRKKTSVAEAQMLGEGLERQSEGSAGDR